MRVVLETGVPEAMVVEPMVPEPVVPEAMVVKAVMSEAVALEEGPRVPEVVVSEAVMLEHVVPKAPMVPMRERVGREDQDDAQHCYRRSQPIVELAVPSFGALLSGHSTTA